MKRDIYILSTLGEIARAMKAIRMAPHGSRVELKGPKRTLAQNDRLHAMCADVARQVEHFGQRYDTEQWKAIFLHGFGKETQFVPSLDGTELVPLRVSSTDLSVQEMSELFEYIYAEGTIRGVVFHYPESQRLASLGERVA